MANTERGEVTLTVEGKSYTLKLPMNAACDLEDRMCTDKVAVSLRDVIIKAAYGSARHIRALFWATLQHHHKDEIRAFEDVGALLERADQASLDAAFKALVGSTEPDEKDVADAGVVAQQARPRKTQAGRAGTGGRSKSTAARSA
jgi:hypothetical protein